jgi:hypothetical protein
LEEDNRQLRLQLESLLNKQTQQQQWAHELPRSDFVQPGEQNMRSTSYSSSSYLPRPLANQFPQQQFQEPFQSGFMPQYQQPQMYTPQYAHNLGFAPSFNVAPQMMASGCQSQPLWNISPPARGTQNSRADAILALMSSTMQADSRAAAMYYSNAARESNIAVYNSSLNNNRQNMQTLNALYMQQCNEY